MSRHAHQPAPRPPPPPKPARIDIAASACIDAAATHARIAQVLERHRATFADLNVRVDATPSTESTEVRVVITRSSGDAGLDRSYTLGPSDCASATDLVALGIDRFLDAFPHRFDRRRVQHGLAVGRRVRK